MSTRARCRSMVALLLCAACAGAGLGQDDLPVRSDLEAAQPDEGAAPRARPVPIRLYEYQPPPAERAREFALTAFCTAYFFVLGGMVGSFLNVVAWRMPRGENIVSPGSRCPKCGVPIRLSDNIPIVSWLWLRGRCRACGQPISPRYAVVEAAMASLFLWLAWWELLSGGRNLPVRPPNQRTGVMWILWETQWDLIAIYAYHCCLISVVAAIVLIALDGQRVPRRLMGFALTVGLAAPLACAWLRPMAFWWPWHAGQLPDSLRGVLDGAAGMATGCAAGALIARLGTARRQPPEAPTDEEAGLVESHEEVAPSATAAPNELSPGLEQTTLPSLALRAGMDSLAAANSRRATVAVMTCAGTYLGWQAALAVGLLAMAGSAAFRVAGALWPAARRVPTAIHAGLGILALLALWRWLFEALAAG